MAKFLGVYVIGFINGTKEKPYSFTDDHGVSRNGTTYAIRLHIGEKTDDYGDTVKVYCEVRVPEEHWSRLKSRAAELSGKLVSIGGYAHSYNRGLSILRAHELTEIVPIDENSKVIGGK